MLTRRSMLLTNTATVAVGMGLYFGFLGLTGFVQTPTETGYVFRRHRAGGQRGVPAARSTGGFVTALASGRYIDRYGARPVLLAGTATGIAGFVLLAAAHASHLAGDRRRHPDQRLHQPGLRSAAGPGGPRGGTERDGCGDEHQRDCPDRRRVHRGGVVAVLLSRTSNGHAPESSYTVIFGPAG